MYSSSTSAQNVEPTRHTLVLTNRLDDLAILSEWLGDLSNQLQLSARGAFRLELVLVEAVTNVISHGFEDQEEHKIQVMVDSLDKMLSLEVRDDGIPYDPLQHKVELPKRLEDAKEGGLGIHLIRSYVDDCHYIRDGNQNVLMMRIYDSPT